MQHSTLFIRKRFKVFKTSDILNYIFLINLPLNTHTYLDTTSLWSSIGTGNIQIKVGFSLTDGFEIIVRSIDLESRYKFKPCPQINQNRQLMSSSPYRRVTVEIQDPASISKYLNLTLDKLHRQFYVLHHINLRIISKKKTITNLSVFSKTTISDLSVISKTTISDLSVISKTMIIFYH